MRGRYHLCRAGDTSFKLRDEKTLLMTKVERLISLDSKATTWRTSCTLDKFISALALQQ